MLNKDLVLGLLTVALTCVSVDGTLTDPLASSPDTRLSNQAVLQSISSPKLPKLGWVTVGDMSREFRISVPDSYNCSKQWPLIIDFHGRDGSSEGQWDNSQYYLKSAGQDYIVIYPVGCYGEPSAKHKKPERAWQGAPYADKDCDDISFVSTLVQTAQTNYTIDSKRIYASGKSNGGGFVDTLACSPINGTFAAFAMAAAALYTDTLIGPDTCTSKQARPVLESHGTDDDTVPFNGRGEPESPYNTPNITQWAQRWAKRNGCDPDKDLVPLDPPKWGLNTTYSCNNLSGIVQQYRIDGLGHCWSSMTDNTDYRKADGSCEMHLMDFTQAVLDFFAKW